MGAMGKMGKSETVSEKKRKRGRPKIIPDRERSILKGLCPEVRTERGLQDAYFWMYALQVLGYGREEQFLHLCDEKRDKNKLTVLSELGRFGDPHVMRELALTICEHQLSAREAVRWLREIRTGKQPQADADQLADAIVMTIKDYAAGHQGTDQNVIAEALRVVGLWAETLG